ncbi:MAG: hypothetical protein KAG18_00010 [Sinobacterium sp.]|nr:hypothetical protein [Sinobacterium sp.]
MNRKIIRYSAYLFVWAVTYLAASVQADIVVLGSPDVPALDRVTVKQVFLKKTQEYANGVSATPYDLPGENDLKWRFYQSLMGRTPSQINSYWSRAFFISAVEPPLVLATEEIVIQKVQSGSGLISYIDAKHVKPGMNIIYRVSE